MPDPRDARREHLLAMYRQTVYRIEAPQGGLAFRIGAPLSPALDALLAGRPAVFLSAANPLSQPLPEAENAAREAALRQRLAEAGWPVLAGVGEGPDPAWTPEPSLLVAGMTAEDAAPIAEAFGQYALVALAPGAAPRLVFTSLWRAA